MLTRTEPSRALAGSLLIVVAASCTGLLGPLARTLYDAGLTPFGFIAWRALIGSAGLAVVVAWQARRGRVPASIRRLPPRQRLGLLAATACSLGVNVTLFVAYQRLPIAVALLAFYTYPAILAVYGRATGTESLGAPKLVALAAALAGMALVVAGGTGVGTGAIDAAGLVMAFIAAVGGALWIGLGRTYGSVPADQAMAIVLAGTSLGGVVLALLAEPIDALALPLRDPAIWPTLAICGLVAASLSSVLFIAGVRLVSRVRAAVLALFEPVVGVLAAALLLRETLGPVQLAGGALVLAAAIMIQRVPDGSGGTDPDDWAPARSPESTAPVTIV